MSETGRPVSLRGAWSATAVLLLAAGLSGCAVGTSNGTIRQNLAGELTAVLDGRGLPVEAGATGCQAAGPGGRISCYASSDNSPPANISATFVPDSHRHRRGCPGRLVVHGNGYPLTAVTVDPCR